jgi:hypothetical protein
MALEWFSSRRERALQREDGFIPSRKDKPQELQCRANQRHYAREGLVETRMKLKGQVATEI